MIWLYYFLQVLCGVPALQRAHPLQDASSLAGGKPQMKHSLGDRIVTEIFSKNSLQTLGFYILPILLLGIGINLPKVTD